MEVRTETQVPFSNGTVELQALDGHRGPPVRVLRLEHGAEAPSAQVVQVRQLLVRDHRQGAGQAADVHTAHSRARLHGSSRVFLRKVSEDLSAGRSACESGTILCSNRKEEELLEPLATLTWM